MDMMEIAGAHFPTYKKGGLGVGQISLSEKAVFLKLSRIPSLFLILLRIFLKRASHFSSPLCSFYFKVTADGTHFPDLVWCKFDN